MCILFIAVNQHRDYPLILLANRDEFYQRPTAPSQFWQQDPRLLAGRDLEAGGSWMGITTSGRLAAVTNIRAPATLRSDAKTRGELVSQYLQSYCTASDYLSTLRQQREQYNGYNLLFGDVRQLQVYNNHNDQVESLHSGFYGLSNASLNSPWPKLNRGVAALRDYCHGHAPLNTSTLFSLLQDNTVAADNLLPDTGVPLEWERRLSSIFIKGDDYGTRSSTIVLLSPDNQVSWWEQTYLPGGQTNQQQHFQFTIADDI